MTTSTVELEALNQMNVEAFTRMLEGVFEHSRWIPMQAHAQKPFNNVEHLHSVMVDISNAASVEAQLRLLCAHPQLAGKEAERGKLTQSSEDEQASVGMNALNQDEMTNVKRLNKEYIEKFEFPFIIAVRNNTKSEIFSQWKSRLKNSYEQEFETGLEQVYQIGKIRLNSLINC